MTSWPMPSPAITAIFCMSVLVEEGVRLGQHLMGSFLGDVVAAVHRAAADLLGGGLPERQRLEAAADDTVAAPQHAQRLGDAPAGVAVGTVMGQVDASAGAVVGADARSTAGAGDAALVFRPGLGGE